MAANGLHIAIAAEKIFGIGGLEIANTLSTSFFVTALLAVFLFYARTKIENTSRPSRFQSFLEMIVDGIYGLVDGVTESSKKTAAFVPLIGSFLLFIMLNNWFELLPGVHTIVFTGKPTIEFANLPAWMDPNSAYASTEVVELTAETDEAIIADEHSEAVVTDDHAGEEMYAEATEEHVSEDAHDTEGEHAEEEHSKGVALFRGANADLNMTLAIALISVAATQVYGVWFAGLGYFKKFLNFSDPVSFFIGILEILAEISKIISFAFRLFGNIFAGEVLISVITFLIPVFIPIPFIGFEIFVGALQAYVFAMLSLVFFNMAASEHHH